MATRIVREDPHTPRFKSKSAHRHKNGKRFGPNRSENYLMWVRTHACCVCGAPGPSEASHHGPRGIGQKTSDYRTVPLCSACHRAWHQHGHFARPALDTRPLALLHVYETMLGMRDAFDRHESGGPL